MFDCNKFKRSVKDWIQSNPQASVADLVDFCEEQIPPQQFATHQWLVDQTVSWYRHILSHRDATSFSDHDEDESAN
jgi:hypothetical protein